MRIIYESLAATRERSICGQPGFPTALGAFLFSLYSASSRVGAHVPDAWSI